MGTKQLEEKIAAHRGPYKFDFSRQEDCDSFFEEFGGEENLRQSFPAIHARFVTTRQNATERKLRAADAGATASLRSMAAGISEANSAAGAGEKANSEEKETSFITADRIICTRNIVSDRNTFTPSKGSLQIQSALTGAFIDPSKTIAESAPASPWVGVTVTTTVVDNTTGVVISTPKSAYFENANSLAYTLRSEPKVPAAYENKSLSVIYSVQAGSPTGEILYTKETRHFTSGQVYPISYIEVDHPTELTKGQKQKIIMLYGRKAEQEIYNSCDYGGNATRTGINGQDFLNNAFSQASNTIRLLLPLKGRFAINAGFTAVGVDNEVTDIMSRPVVSYDYKAQTLPYRSSESNSTVYEQVKNRFVIQPQKDSQGRTIVEFDIKYPCSGRSDYDWHTDVKGELNGNPKQIRLFSGFSYAATYDSNKQTHVNGIEIESISPEELAVLPGNREYYVSIAGSNTVYVPPIVIYWGCFGRDSRIKYADGTLRKASEIKAGDVLVSWEGKSLVVDDIVTGTDETIHHIKTDKDETKVSIGHPFRCGGERIKACDIKAGDKLAIDGGEVATVLSNAIVPYGDAVYNFTFEGEENGNYLIADGFLSGDLYMQNTLTEAKPYELTEEEKKFAEEMLRLAELGG